jgi:hypothetical protein
MIQPGDRILVLNSRDILGREIPGLEGAILNVQEVDEYAPGEPLTIRAGGRVWRPEYVRQVEVEVKEVATAIGN